MDPRTGVSPGLKVMVDRATRRKFAWQQSPLAACPQKVKDGVEDGTKVGGSRSPARSRSRQNWRNKSPRCVVHVGGVESSAHRTSYGPSGPDQRSFKTDVNFSNTLLALVRTASSPQRTSKISDTLSSGKSNPSWREASILDCLAPFVRNEPEPTRRSTTPSFCKSRSARAAVGRETPNRRTSCTSLGRR